ncbi:nucleotidyltransferase domain-containing protein [Jeotgalibacillus aurantiacus]|uniref:nucleotidyltransferase domain-containing protein n=1 Tax=Jeotgalibacillus aurantiacus TaxID=2763266 RepID=UPI001D09BCC6|nr:nucleotidyltransferase domain-containing protein [Jeotgalibacillus aurantiacus]
MGELPGELKGFMGQLLDQLTHELTGYIESVYVYGSIATGSYVKNCSDIDMVFVVNDRISVDQVRNALSPSLNLKFGKQLDAMFIRKEDLGKMNHELAPYPYIHNGRVKEGHWDINAITWWMLAHQAICMFGSPQQMNITWEDVENTLRYNLEHYWTGKSKTIFSFIRDSDFAFAMATVSRIGYTFETGEIVSKRGALIWMKERSDVQWVRLLKEAESILNKRRSGYFSKIYRAYQCKKFVKEIIHYDWRKKDDQYSNIS